MSILNKIENSFMLSSKGQESMQIVMWYWGGIAYFAAYILNKMIIKIDSRIFDVTASLLVTVYFCWHIFILVKCSPKKPKLSPEEKQRIKLERKKDRTRRFMRKLLLQEPITKWNPTLICGAIDLCFITTFSSYI